ncbi:type II toxin-antitoxin system Phd/YefM family antitoxin [Leptolyngbya sp. FACHB-711]|uniref:type II toxin-antitoxin system Phd/YefM family antitoxin n=1 Tax=unclassified Leptolyngbya TaxID=2650499 RepID=UPI001684B4D4|nr:type II toxin-antitoxin system Phd/YefM family antitoxin [Leptolyngbya sp. FACHB-711]MBD1853733.1 type II toxin-antitoxin system Phd/YefM family antitoxin [Cyanobacteria bacterium FACHB-502]MBD2026088.1 type II toxin-antitoxin system Phd/YefM family antitoxin [Leptolyngbya sp. FACHB-711]
MSISVNLPETPEQLAALIDRIQAGEELLLIKEGVAIAHLVPTHPRIPGQDKGRVMIAPDFNAPLPEDILNDFVNPT